MVKTWYAYERQSLFQNNSPLISQALHEDIEAQLIEKNTMKNKLCEPASDIAGWEGLTCNYAAWMQ